MNSNRNANRISQDSQYGIQMNPLINENSSNTTLDDIHKILIEFQKIYIVESQRETVIESTTSGQLDNFIDDYISKIPIIGQSLGEKLRKSNVTRLLKGDVKSSDIDPMANTFALSHALLLTIVANYSLNLADGSVLGYLQDNIAVCNIDGTDSYWYNLFFIPVWNLTVGAFFLNSAGLCLISLYYVCRPTGMVHFQSWLKCCGYIFVPTLLLTFVSSFIMTLLPILYYELWLDLASGDLCSQVEMVSAHGPYALVARYRNCALIYGCCVFFFGFVLFKMI